MAHQNLQGLELAGMAIKITPVPEGYGVDMGPVVAPGELDDDEGGGLVRDSGGGEWWKGGE